MKKVKIKDIALSAIFVAIIAATAWISIPTPIGINLTLQIFGVCLAGFYLGAKKGITSTLVYIIMGAVGLPVFSFFTGGIGILIGTSGGFLWGFLPAVILCGLAFNNKSKIIKTILIISAILICHIFGVAQYSFVSGVNVWVAILTTSLPFLVKDIAVAFIANIIVKKIKKQK